MKRYAWLLTNYPQVIILFDIVLVVVVTSISMTLYGLPAFKEPLKGVSPRGTVIGGRQKAMGQVADETASGELTTAPRFPDSSPSPSQSGTAVFSCLDEPIMGLPNPRMVLEPTTSGKNLLSAEHLRAACEWENKHVRPFHKGRCSDLHSLHLYIRALNGKNISDCSDISDADVTMALKIVQNCSRYYFDGLLARPCAPGNPACAGVPQQCYKHGAVYKILHYLTDVDFVKDGDTTKTTVAYSVLYIRNARDMLHDIWMGDWFADPDELRDYYMDELDGGAVGKDLVKSRAMSLNVAPETLTKYVFKDLMLFGVAMGSILILLFFYLRSVVLMFATMANVGCTISVSYFLYMVVYRIPFFPFMNIVAGLLLIAIGADGVFILYDLKEEAQRHDKDASLETAVLKMLKHGALSIFVTSCTTAAAVFSNVISNVTSLRCFGIYGGTCVLINLWFLLTFAPAVIVLREKVNARHPIKCCRTRPEDEDASPSRLSRVATLFWKTYLPNAVTRFAPLWITLFLIIGIAGLIVVFVAPKLKVQSEREYPIFHNKQAFELYRWHYRESFRFELEQMARERSRMNVQVVWGVDGTDNGNQFNPDDPGTLRFDGDFDLYHPDSQKFLRQFCTDLLKQSFVYDASNYECFFDLVAGATTESCVNKRHRCCDKGPFPITVFDARDCLKNDSVQALMTSTRQPNKTVIGQAIYDSSGKAVAFRYSFQTNENWTTDYSDMNTFYKKVDRYMKDQLTVDAHGLDNGWLVGLTGLELGLYDLQDALSRGTLLGIALSIGIGFLVLLFTSLNIFITLYAMLTISLTIAVTMAALVLLGWEVTLFDSIVISLAVGLSIDFSIHYGIGYKVAPSQHRKDRVHDVLCSIGSAVAMAAITTFAAGTSVSFGLLVTYKHFGTFLMLVMTISWCFGTLFFLPLLSVVGPRQGFGEISCSKKNDEAEKAEDEEATGSEYNMNGQVQDSSNKGSFSSMVKPDNRVSPDEMKTPPHSRPASQRQHRPASPEPPQKY
ncbi:hypothetical protein NP493_810g01041 [Ridgeia piscesae]|uniref:SSD domain-containing protein n=1 Tax=Ridgeia piscesae TaxID=27915 RepID=A0AAD9KNC1_RIDPI|nr:hypothetical protein NP493_810g01041 [Ridgeia piscesae]